MRPRSAQLNTEIDLLVDSPEVAAEVTAIIEQGMQPGQSWQVALCRPDTSPLRCRRGQLLWLHDPRQPAGANRHDPQSTAWSRALATVLSWLPLDPLI